MSLAFISPFLSGKPIKFGIGTPSFFRPMTSSLQLNGFFVSTTAVGGGSGTLDNPLTIFEALARSASITPGQNTTLTPDGSGSTKNVTTVWVRSGSYNIGAADVVLSGSNSSNPVCLRAYPGEVVKLNGRFNSLFTSPYLWIWGIIVENNDFSSSNQDKMGFDVRSNGMRIIHCVSRKHSGNAFGIWENEQDDGEIYGSIGTLSGYFGSGQTSHGHGIYCQNEVGTRKIRENLMYNNFGFGYHFFGSEAADFINVDVIGNQGWGNSSLRINDGGNDFVLNIGGTLNNIIWNYNGVWDKGYSTGGNGAIGKETTGSFEGRITIENNWFGKGTAIGSFATASFVSNSMGQYDGNGQIRFWRHLNTFAEYNINGNTYYYNPNSHPYFNWRRPDGISTITFTQWQFSSSRDTTSTQITGTNGRPASTEIIVRVSQYEPKGNNIATRGHVVVRNWETSSIVNVDLSNILNIGDQYKIYHVHDIETPLSWGQGMYTGGLMPFDLTNVPEAPAPQVDPSWSIRQGGNPNDPHDLGVEFNCFVVRKVVT